LSKLRILIDECLDKRLAEDIPNAFVKTVPQMGWAGLTNGKLLDQAQNHFDIFITSDQNLSFQQNLDKFKIVVVVLCPATSKIDDLKLLVPQLLRQIPKLKMGVVYIR